MDWNKLFECFYRRFLLRDFLGKMVPGGIVVGACCHGVCGQAAETIPLVVWIFLAGVAWLAGFAIQAISELLLPWRPIMNGEHAEEQVEERLDVLGRFSEDGRRDFERLVVVEEICRNGAMALVLLVVIALAKSFETATFVITLCGILAILGLFRASHYCEKIKKAYRQREVPGRPAAARRKTAKKKTAKKIAKKKTAKRKRS